VLRRLLSCYCGSTRIFTLYGESRALDLALRDQKEHTLQVLGDPEVFDQANFLFLLVLLQHDCRVQDGHELLLGVGFLELRVHQGCNAETALAQSVREILHVCSCNLLRKIDFV